MDEDPFDFDRIFGEIPIASSSSSSSSSSVYEIYYDYLPLKNQSFSQSNQNPLVYDTNLEASLGLLSLSPTVSAPPSPSSYPYSFFYRNPILDSLTADPVYSTRPYDPMQHIGIELDRRIRTRDSLSSQSHGSIAEELTLPGLRYHSMVYNDQYRNGYLPSPPRRSSPSPRSRNNGVLMSGGSNGIGFRLDSTRHFEDGVISELNYLNHHRRGGYSLKKICDQSSLDVARGQMFDWARDQHGCRFLQKKFVEGTEEERAIIFSELKDWLCELMVDQFGNYLVQKLIELSSEEQRNLVLILVTVTPDDLTFICRNPHGTRVVQKLLQYLTTQKQISIFVITLISVVAVLMKDMNGHHVVQYCVEHFSDKDNKYLYHAIADRCLEVATDRFGCCLLQKCLELATGEERDHLVAEITKNALVLSQNDYGNFVVQYVATMNIPHYTSNLIRQLEGNFVSLSMQKFSSNVVEKCIVEARKEDSTRIIKELLDSSNFLPILQDAFGNYVVQTALEALKGPIRDAIVAFVQNHLPSLRNHLYGKRVITKINSL